MENQYSFYRNHADLLPLRLQLFGGTEQPENTGGEASGAEPGAAKGESPKMLTQEEVDELITRRLARAQKDADKRLEAARAEARKEGERLARMNDDERARHDREQSERAASEREEALNRREQEIVRRELRAEANEILTQRGLPRELEQLLNYGSADACKESIDAVEKVYRTAVQQGVDERLRQSGSRVEGNGRTRPDYSKMSDEEYYKTTYKKG